MLNLSPRNWEIYFDIINIFQVSEYPHCILILFTLIRTLLSYLECSIQSNLKISALSAISLLRFAITRPPYLFSIAITLITGKLPPHPTNKGHRVLHPVASHRHCMELCNFRIGLYNDFYLRLFSLTPTTLQPSGCWHIAFIWIGPIFLILPFHSHKHNEVPETSLAAVLYTLVPARSSGRS